MITEVREGHCFAFLLIKKPGASPRRTALKLQTQQADRVAGDTDDEEANDDPQRVNFLTQQPHTGEGQQQRHQTEASADQG